MKPSHLRAIACCSTAPTVLITVLLVLIVTIETRAVVRAGLKPQTSAQQSNNQEPKPADVQELKLGVPIERELKGGEGHSYRVMLTAGQYMKVVVEQKSIDVVVKLFGPDGKQITEVDSPDGIQGPERVSLIREVTEEYRLEVQSSDKGATAGNYEIKIQELREATSRDRDRVAAERIVEKAQQLLNQQTAESLRTAIKKYEEALPLWRALEDKAAEADTLHTIGYAYSRISEQQEALKYYAQSLELWRVVGDRQNQASALTSIGMTYFRTSQSDIALKYLNQALPLSRSVGDRRQEAVTLNNIGTVYVWLGQLQEALPYFNQSLPLSRAVKYRQLEVTTLNNIAVVYEQSGDLQQALDRHLAVLPLRRALGDRRGEAITLSNIAGVYSALSDLQKALEYYNQSLPLLRVTGHRQQEATTLQGIGATYNNLGEFQKALQYLDQALALSRAVGDRRQEAYVLNSIGSTHRRLGETSKSLNYYNQSLSLRRAVGDRRGEAKTLNSIGHSYLTLGEPQKALEHNLQALQLSRDVRNPVDEADSLYGIARAESVLGNTQQARTHIEAALNLIESTRSKVTSQELRTSFLASNQDFYEFYVDLLMRMHRSQSSAGYDAAALQASERARARSLLEILIESRADIRQGVDSVLVDRERSLQEQLNFKSERLTRLLSGKRTEEQETAARKEVEALLADYQDIQAEIRAKSPRYAALTQPQPLDLKGIQQLLDKDTLLLEYSLGEERSFVWAVTPTSIKGLELPKRAEIETAARRFHKLVTENENRELQAQVVAAADLSQMLLAPVAAQLGQKRLVIVSDGALHYVPFAALPTPPLNRMSQAVRAKRSARRGTQDYQPLILQHEIVQLPSASVLGVLRRETVGRVPASRMVAVLADPVFQGTDPRVQRVKRAASESGNAAATQSNESASAAEVKRSAWESGLQDLQRLPFTRTEAETIVALALRGQGFKALDFDASRTAITSGKVGDYRIVHFATHGLLNSAHPELSGIVLSLVDEAGQPQNGFLRLHEIYNLKLPADLVVLSGCQTALGKQVKGEGLVGLTRGFMYAGVPRIVVSLWDVTDEATAELMKKFYEGMLKKGMRPAAALRAAQLSMARSRWWNAPYYWAAFELQGEFR